MISFNKYTHLLPLTYAIIDGLDNFLNRKSHVLKLVGSYMYQTVNKQFESAPYNVYYTTLLEDALSIDVISEFNNIGNYMHWLLDNKVYPVHDVHVILNQQFIGDIKAKVPLNKKMLNVLNTYLDLYKQHKIQCSLVEINMSGDETIALILEPKYSSLKKTRVNVFLEKYEEFVSTMNF